MGTNTDQNDDNFPWISNISCTLTLLVFPFGRTNWSAWMPLDFCFVPCRFLSVDYFSRFPLLEHYSIKIDLIKSSSQLTSVLSHSMKSIQNHMINSLNKKKHAWSTTNRRRIHINGMAVTFSEFIFTVSHTTCTIIATWAKKQKKESPNWVKWVLHDRIFVLFRFSVFCLIFCCASVGFFMKWSKTIDTQVYKI